MLTRGDIQLQQDEAGRTQLLVRETPRTRTPPESRASTANSTDMFRRGVEKYTGGKR
jgi:hypothetical protein